MDSWIPRDLVNTYFTEGPKLDFRVGPFHVGMLDYFWFCSHDHHASVRLESLHFFVTDVVNWLLVCFSWWDKYNTVEYVLITVDNEYPPSSHVWNLTKHLAISDSTEIASESCGYERHVP